MDIDYGSINIGVSGSFRTNQSITAKQEISTIKPNSFNFTIHQSLINKLHNTSIYRHERKIRIDFNIRGN